MVAGSPQQVVAYLGRLYAAWWLDWATVACMQNARPCPIPSTQGPCMIVDMALMALLGMNRSFVRLSTLGVPGLTIFCITQEWFDQACSKNGAPPGNGWPSSSQLPLACTFAARSLAEPVCPSIRLAPTTRPPTGCGAS